MGFQRLSSRGIECDRLRSFAHAIARANPCSLPPDLVERCEAVKKQLSRRHSCLPDCYPAEERSCLCSRILAADQVKAKTVHRVPRASPRTKRLVMRRRVTRKFALGTRRKSPRCNYPRAQGSRPRAEASACVRFGDTGGDPRGAGPSKTPGDTMSGPATQSSVAAARVDRAKLRGLAGDISTASFPAQSILGQSFTGLRRAARSIPDALSNRASADYVAAFRTTPSDLDPGHFTGAATKPLALAQGYVRITESPAPLRRN